MKTVLVVDDSTIMRDIVKSILTDDLKIACQFLEAANGKKAFQLLENNKVNIIFLDWNMPEMDGLEFLQKVRAMPDYNDLPIIMVTSESAKYDVVEALQSGATDYIVKPVESSVFKRKLSEITF